MATSQSLFGAPAAHPTPSQASPLSSTSLVLPTGNQMAFQTQRQPVTFSFGPPEEVHFDPNGDTRLFVQSPLGIKKVFIVSSKAMMFVCDAWNRMLAPDGYFKEAQPNDGKREISFPEDDMNALSILLNIAHLRFDKVPASLNFRGLLAVSVLAEKYEATRAFQPWLTRWIDGIRNTISLPAHEEWLWIAWALGEQTIFTEVAARLVREVRVNAAGQCVTPAGGVLDPMNGLSYFPPGIIESILRIRLITVTKLLEACYSYLDKYLANYAKPNAESLCTHCRDRKNHECDAKILGSFIISLQGNGLTLTREDPRKAQWSINELSEKLSNITIFDCCAPYSMLGQNCNFTSQLRKIVDGILLSLPSAAQESHIRHMERQQRHF